MKSIILKVINLYSAYSATKPARCRFYPSCSQFCRQAVENHGAMRGLFLSLKRFLRCNPFGSFGIDPVPEKKLG